MIADDELVLASILYIGNEELFVEMAVELLELLQVFDKLIVHGDARVSYLVL